MTARRCWFTPGSGSTSDNLQKGFSRLTKPSYDVTMVTTILTRRKEPFMNRKSIVVSLAAVAFLLCTIRFASAQPKGETVTLKGEVVDLWCYLEGGDKGAD